MFDVSKKDLWNMHTLAYRHGLIGGVVITPVTLENGLIVSKDVNYFYDNKDIVVRFYYSRLDNGRWYNLVRVQYENIKTQKVLTFNNYE